MGYILKYAVIYEEYDGAFKDGSGEWELAGGEYFNSEEEALDFIEDMNKED